MVQHWYSKLTATFPAAIKFPSGIQDKLSSRYQDFKALTYFQCNLILWYCEDDPKKTKVPCLKVLKRLRRVGGRFMHLFPCQLNKVFLVRFLSILFVLSSLHYRKCIFRLCSQWIYILVLGGRLTCMTNLTNNVMQCNLVLNHKLQKSALLRTGDYKGKLFLRR